MSTAYGDEDHRSIEIVKGVLWSVGGSLAVNGDNTSWIGRGLSGKQRMGCFFLRDTNSSGVLIDTGPAILRSAVIDQVKQLVGRNGRLSVFLSRSEFESVGNLAALSQNFSIEGIYTGGVLSSRLDGFGNIGFSQGNEALQIKRVATETTVAVSQCRKLTFFTPSLRMLSAYWSYDQQTKALFPSDAFGYTIDSDDINERDAWKNLSARYWWLPGSKTSAIQQSLSAIFEKVEIEHICPAHGCIISGRNKVLRHYELVQQMLRDASNR